MSSEIITPGFARVKPFLTWERLEQDYDETLDMFGAVQIGALSYMPSDILKSTDPIAYRVGLSDYADYMSEDYDIEGF